MTSDAAQDMQKARRSLDLIWPLTLVLMAFALLVGLGVWQLERKTWKDGLIAQIAERTRAAPVSLDAAEAETREGDGEYLRVTARGRFAHDKELFLWAPDPKLGPGFHLYTPFEVGKGRYVFVNRGFVPERMKGAEPRSGVPAAEDSTVTGLVRVPAEPGLFTPANNVAANIWFWRDLDGMAAAAFGTDGAPVLPFFIDAEASIGDQQGWPRGGVTRLELPNRHLEYAWTWFGLAATLLAVFLAFVCTRKTPPAGLPE